MPAHAGYAAAVTIREQVLNDALLGAYRAQQLRHSLTGSFGGIPAPSGSVNFFVQAPQVVLSAADHNHAVLRLTGWGRLAVRPSGPPTPSELHVVQWQADLRITAQALSIGTAVLLSAKKEDYRLVDWQLDVLDGTGFSPAAQAYLDGDAFKAQLETRLGDMIGDVLFPIVDFRLLGPFTGSSFTNIALRVVHEALMLGFDMDTGVFATNGDPEQLNDFAGDDDVAVAINPNALKALMPTAERQVQDQVQQNGATLESLSIACEEGRFRVSGRASMTDLGAANFSLAVIPRMMYGRPGAYIPMTKKTMVIKARVWPALSFAVAEPEVDIDRPDWLVVVDFIGGVVSLGFIPFAIEAFIAEMAGNIARGMGAADFNSAGPTPRVQRLKDPPIRLGIERFDIHATGVFVGISSRLEAPLPILSGIRSMPRNFAGRSIRYEVRLPYDVLPDDPYLRIRWTVIDLDSGSVLLNDDGAALNRSVLEFIPTTLGAQVDRFAVSCRVYRPLGPFVTDLFNETIRLDVGPSLSPGAFVRWRYDVKNPQIALNESTDTYSYLGDRVVSRWSKFHRADKPCQNVKHRSRYTYSDEVLDDLPFPVKDMTGNRYRLCDYCFFGGPGSTIAAL